MSEAFIGTGALLVLGLGIYAVGAWILGGEGRRILEHHAPMMGDTTPGDDTDLFVKRRRSRYKTRPVEYDRPMELDFEEGDALVPPPFEVDGRNPNGA